MMHRHFTLVSQCGTLLSLIEMYATLVCLLACLTWNECCLLLSLAPFNGNKILLRINVFYIYNSAIYFIIETKLAHIRYFKYN